MTASVSAKRVRLQTQLRLQDEVDNNEVHSLLANFENQIKSQRCREAVQDQPSSFRARLWRRGAKKCHEIVEPTLIAWLSELRKEVVTTVRIAKKVETSMFANMPFLLR